MNTAELIAALARKPEFASLAINLLVAVISLILAYRRRRGGQLRVAQKTSEIDFPQETGTATGSTLRRAFGQRDEGQRALTFNEPVIVSRLPAWLGACAGFHLLSTILFSFNLLQAAWMITARPTADMAMPASQMALLLFLCIMIGLSALSLANLTERLSIEDGQGVSLPLVPAAIGLVVFEGVIFALKQPNFCYLVSEGAWLLACILMTAGLLRLPRKVPLGAIAQLMALLTAIGFFARAAIALLFVINLGASFLLSNTSFNLADLGGLIAAVLTMLPLLKAISIAWTGIGLLLLALTWRGATTRLGQ